jgi:hypothetical protein
MPVARKPRFAAGELVVCIESFSSSYEDYSGCRRGTKLRGDHPIVKRWPQYFLPADSSDDEVFTARAKLYADAGAAPPS